MSRQFFINLAGRSSGRQSSGKTTPAPVRPSLKPVFMPPAPTLPVAETSAPQIPAPEPVREMGSRKKDVPVFPRVSGRMGADHAGKNDPRRPAPKVGVQDHLAPEVPAPPARHEPPVAVSPVKKNNLQDRLIRSDLPAAAPRQRPSEPLNRSPRGRRETAAEPGQLAQQLKTGDKAHRQGKSDFVRKKPEMQKPFGKQAEKQAVNIPISPEPSPLTPQHIVVKKTTVERGRASGPERTEPPQIQKVRGGVDAEQVRAVPEKVPVYGTPFVKSARIVEKPLSSTTTSGPEVMKNGRSAEGPEKRVVVKVQEAPRASATDRTSTTEKKENRVSPLSPTAVEVARITPASEHRRSLQPKPQQGDKSPSVLVNIGLIDLQVRSTEQPGVKAQYRRKRPQGFAGFQRRRTYSGWEE